MLYKCTYMTMVIIFIKILLLLLELLMISKFNKLIGNTN